MSAIRRGKGMRVSCDGMSGEGFSLKHLGKSISKGVSDAGKSVGKALTSKEGKIATKSLIDVGLPVALGGVGELVGGPAGALAGASMGSLAGKELEGHYGQMGYGMHMPMKKRGRPRKRDLVRSAIDDIEDLGYIIKSKEGGKLKGVAKSVSKGLRKASQKVIGKKATRQLEPVLDKAVKSKVVQDIGKQIVEQGATAIGTSIGAYIGGPEGAMLGAELGSSLGKAGASQIGKKNPLKNLVTIC